MKHPSFKEQNISYSLPFGRKVCRLGGYMGGAVRESSDKWEKGVQKNGIFAVI